MRVYILGIIAALVSGVFVSIQGIFNAVLERHIGLVGIMCWIHFVGFVFSIPLVVVYKPNLLQTISQALQENVPFYVILSGTLGLIIVPGVAFAIIRTNAAVAFSILVVGQLLVSLSFQYFGLMGIAKQEISSTQILALGLVVTGVGLFFAQR